MELLIGIVNQPINYFPMKNLLYIPLSLFFVFLISACDNSENDIAPEEAITTEEAFYIVEGSVTNTSEGLTQEVVDAALLAENLICNTSFDSTFTRSYDGDRVSANFQLDWEWSIACNGFGVPTELQFSSSTQGDFESLRIESASSAAGSYLVTGLNFGSPSYVLSGNYNRQGSQALKVGEMNSFNSTVALTVTDLSVSKSSYTIESGGGTFTLSGTNKEGKSFLVEGTIVFHGNRSATLTINGEEFDLNW